MSETIPVRTETKIPSMDIEPFLEARAFAYDILKCVFMKEPSKQLIALLKDGEIIQSFPLTEGGDFAEAKQAVAGYLGQKDVLSTEKHEKLRWDFTRMFISPEKLPAPPWGSRYLDFEHLHFADETVQVRQAYRKYGLLPKNLNRDPDDHIGLELDFMHKLSGLAKEQLTEGNIGKLKEILADQASFLEEHLLKWIPLWRKDVVESADTDFYKGMAMLLEAFLKLDSVLIEELASSI